MRSILMIFILALMLGGCATTSQSNLYWGEYSHTLYNVKKNPGDKSNLAHQKELMRIVRKSNQKNLKVPPGVYAELAIYEKENGNHGAANKYFLLEKEVYPEFSVLMKSVAGDGVNVDEESW